MMFRTFCFALTAVLTASCAAPQSDAAATQSPDAIVSTKPAAADAAREAIRRAMNADNIPAMSVAVMRDGELIWSEPFGEANLDTGAPATRDTKFRIGSVSKLFTADLAAVLADKGVVDLDRDIRAYLPQFPDKGAVITLRQLLGHLAGIRHYADKDHDFSAPGGPIDVRIYEDTASILAIFAGDPLLTAPGDAYHYSTFGFTLAGLVLEAAAGEPFPALVAENIFAPAEIDDIAIDDMFAIVPDRAEFYDSIDDYDGLLSKSDYGPVVNAFFLNSAYKIPAGGYVADAEAIAAFGALHVAPGFFIESVYAELFRIQKTNAGEAIDVGLGWRVGEDRRGRRLFQHSGSQQGSRAHIAVYPDDGLSVAILSNMGSRPDDIEGLSLKVAAPFLGAN